MLLMPRRLRSLAVAPGKDSPSFISSCLLPSTNATLKPALPKIIAEAQPAGPAPTITISYLEAVFIICLYV